MKGVQRNNITIIADDNYHDDDTDEAVKVREK